MSEPALSEASRHHGTPGLGASLRNNSHVFDQTSPQYEQFLHAAPQMEDSFQSTFHHIESEQSQPFREQATTDGADVVQLLSVPEEEPIYSEFDELLTENEVARLREAFFANGTSQPAWNHLLSFYPAFVSDPNRSREAISFMGTEDTAVAHETWLGQWHNVLNSYTDEVWGDLGSLVEEARHEIQEIASRTDNPSPESKALDRLRQILAHVRGQV
ncbi:hypothetical protein V2A60_001177 [Cordyceps javanica]|uniref:Uncharacterized protein n=1 Tax=Cordyceps javanica TaxID=43265 RepID=A0A545V2T2_9HYPO|nr:hypothetical protein IF1G_05853 [Cordyceps javanica]TQW06772.1 hypothetical protein IF2G_05156 [Cordyceps javanica]